MSRTALKNICLIFAVVGGGGILCNAEYMPSPPDIVSLQKTAFRDKNPEEIARFLATPDENTQKAAVAALADTPETAIPLVEKLLVDTSPWIRAGAVDVLAEIVKRAEKKKMDRAYAMPRKKGWSTAYQKAKEQDTEAETLAVTLITEHLSEETSDPVLFSVCQLFNAAPFDPEVMRPFVDQAAQSPDPIIRKTALRAYWIENKSPDGLMRTALTVIKNHEMVSNEETLIATLMLQQAAKKVSGRQALPVVADHLLNTVNGTEAPVRRKAWYQAVDRELEIIEKEWDSGAEHTPNVVPALCRAVVRLPYNLEGKQARPQLRARCKALLERCGSASSERIRAWAEKEEAWLTTVSAEDFKRVLSNQSKDAFDPGATRANCRASIAYLKELARRLETKQAANSKTPGKEN